MIDNLIGVLFITFGISILIGSACEIWYHKLNLEFGTGVNIIGISIIGHAALLLLLNGVRILW